MALIKDYSILNFDWETDLSEKSFFVNKSNEKVLLWIQSMHLWNYQTLLIGPEKSGKTHLSNIWKSQTNAQYINKNCTNNINYKSPLIIDQIEQFTPKELFHILFNAINHKTYSLWICTDFSYVNNAIPDIQSRLKAMTHMVVPKPNQEVCINIMRKIFCDFGLEVKNDALTFLINRIKRSYKSIYETVQYIHEQCLIQRRAPSLIFISFIMQNQ